MKRLVAILLLAFALTAHSQSEALKIFLSIPWGLGIHMAQWVMKDNQKVMYVEVTAEGNSLDEARLSGFQIAVERAVGVIVASESEVRNQKLQRDEIITYASGFIDDYQIVDQLQTGTGIWVKMQVWVKHSSLRDRLLSQGHVSSQIDGARIAAQIQSFKNSRESGDRLLAAVLSDYPTRALDIEVGKASVIADSKRKTYLNVPFLVSWNQHFIKSLQEAIQLIDQRPECGGWFNPCRNVNSIISVGKTTSYFDDSLAYDLFWKETVAAQPRVQISLHDVNGKNIKSVCYEYSPLTYSPYPGRSFLDIFEGRVKVAPNQRAGSTVSLELDQLPIKELHQVDIKVVRLNACPKRDY